MQTIVNAVFIGFILPLFLISQICAQDKVSSTDAIKVRLMISNHQKHVHLREEWSGVFRGLRARTYIEKGQYIYPAVGKEHLILFDSSGIVCLTLANGIKIWHILTPTINTIGGYQIPLYHVLGFINSTLWVVDQSKLESISKLINIENGKILGTFPEGVMSKKMLLALAQEYKKIDDKLWEDGLMIVDEHNNEIYSARIKKYTEFYLPDKEARFILKENIDNTRGISRIYLIEVETNKLLLRETIATSSLKKLTTSKNRFIYSDKLFYTIEIPSQRYQYKTIAYNINSGKISWKSDGFIVHAYSDRVYILDRLTRIFSHPVQEGTKRFIYGLNVNSGNIETSAILIPLYPNQRIAFKNEFAFFSSNDSLFSVNLQNGTIVWKKADFPVHVFPSEISNFDEFQNAILANTFPMVIDEIIYAVDYFNNIVALDTETGKELATITIPEDYYLNRFAPDHSYVVVGLSKVFSYVNYNILTQFYHSRKQGKALKSIEKQLIDEQFNYKDEAVFYVCRWVKD